MRKLIAACIALCIGSCGEGATSPNAAFSVLEGSNQTAEAGAQLASITVRTRDPVTGARVGVRLAATVTAPGASVSPPEATTNANGEAAFTWTLGSVVGQQDLTITDVASQSHITVHATAQQPVIASVEVAPASVDLSVGQSQTFVATVRDARGAALSGRSVTWSSSNNAALQIGLSTGVATAVGAGTGIVVTASSEGKSGTASVNVSSLPPTQLVISTQPAGAETGNNLATQPVVDVRNASGGVVTGSTAAVTAQIVTGSGALSGSTTVNAVLGRATFNNLRITGTGVHALVFSSSGLTSATSADFVVAPALTTTQAVQSVTAAPGITITPVTPVTASGGVTPYAFAVSPTLPANLVMNTSTGQISGTPSSALASSVFTVTVTDAANIQSSKTFTLVVSAGLATTQLIAQVGMTINTPVSGVTPVTASGGVAPITYAIAPALPSGLNFSATTGLISGTPAVAQAATTYTVTATDAASASSSKTFELSVNGALTTVQVVATKTGTANAVLPSYTPVTAAGGTAPLAWSITGGGLLPTGLTLNAATGLISGTPTASLTATVFTMTVVDNAGATSSKTFTLTINPAVVTTQAVPTKGWTVDIPLVAFTPVTATGGTAPLTLDISPALPAGLSFNAATGQITGTPTVTQSAKTFTVTATDALNATSSKTFSLTINSALQTSPAVPTKSGTTGTLIPTFTPVTASNGTTPYVFALSGGTLPNGMTFDTNTGAISGTPTTALSATVFTVTVVDAAGSVSAKTFTLTVAAVQFATQLAITTQPGGANSGVDFTVQPVVEIRDGSGVLFTGSSANVTAAIASGTGTLSGGTTVAAVGGVATFSTLRITGTGTFTIVFTSSGLTSATSGNIVIGQVATQLAVTTQPAGAVAGFAFSTQPVVAVRDGSGTLVASSTVAVTATLTSGTGTLLGTVTVNAVAGIATFANLRIDVTGSKQLTFSATGLTSALSSSFSVGSAPTIGLTTTSVSLNSYAGGPNSSTQVITVTNTGGGGSSLFPTLSLGTITYSAGGSGWASVTLDAAAASATISVHAVTGALAAGTYTATVPVLATASNSPLNITVTFVVAAAPAIGLFPSSFTLNSYVGGPNSNTQVITVQNTGGGSSALYPTLSLGTITYSAGGTGWASATLDAFAASATISVHAVTGALAAGTYTATIPVLATASNSPQNLTVTFVVAAAPVISFTFPTLTFNATAGGANPASRGVSILNTGGGSSDMYTGMSQGTITYSAGASGWLQVTLNVFAASASVSVAAVTGSLPAGTYTASIPIIAPLASNSPASISVTFIVSALNTPSIAPASQ